MPKISFKKWAKRNPAMFVGSSFIALLTLSLLFYRINTLHTGPNKYEIEALSTLNSMSSLLKQPVDFIYFGVAKILSFVFSDLTSLRLTSGIFGLMTLIGLRSIIKYWQGTRTANIGILVAGTSFWLISLGRVGHPFIMPAFWLSMLLGVFSWQRYTTKQITAKMLLIIFTCLGIYSPNFIWVVITLLLLASYKYGFKNLIPKVKSPLILIGPALIIPIIITSLNTNILKTLLGADSITFNPINYAENVFRYISQLLFRGGLDPAINLGRLPNLDIFQMVMLLLGASVLLGVRLKLRGLLSISAPMIYILFISIFGFDQTKLAALIPIIFILISVGINEFIFLWLKGFPRNPFGRAMGLILCIGLMSLSGYYNVHRYFVAWAQNPDVKTYHQLNK